MNNKIYHQVKNQPDLQEVATYLKVPLIKLDKIEEKLITLLNNTKDKFIYSELLSKVNKLKDKHLVKLIDNYCNLDLEYRNTSIIKENKNNNEIIKYTSKDIFLQNIGKLIEEINILEYNFNINYNNEDNLNNKSNFKSTEIENNVVFEIEQEKQNKFNIEKKSSFTHVDKKVFLKEEETYSWLEIIKSIGNCGNLLEIYLVFAFIILGSIGTGIIYSKVNTQNKSQQFIKLVDNFAIEASLEAFKLSPQKNNISYKNINDKTLIQKGINKNFYEDGHYKNPFGEKITIFSTTINKPNDSLAMTSAGFEPLVCSKIVFQLQESHPKLVKINENTVIKAGFIAQNKVLSSCNLDNNTITIIK